MKLSKSPKPTELSLACSFDDEAGILRIELRSAPPLNFGTSLAYKLTPDEALDLSRALREFADR